MGNKQGKVFEFWLIHYSHNILLCNAIIRCKGKFPTGDKRRRYNKESRVGGGGFGINGLKPEFQLPTIETKETEDIPFTEKTEQTYIDEIIWKNDRWDYAGGAAIGQWQ